MNTMITTLLARKMADQNQQRTQILSSSTGRILAASAILIEFHTAGSSSSSNSSSTIYQIDPSGQYWICQAVVSGRYASTIEQQFMNRLRERYYSRKAVHGIHDHHHHHRNPIDTTSTTLTRNQVCDVLSQLSVDDALTMATQCVLDGVIRRNGGNNNHLQPQQQSRGSNIQLRGIVLSSTNNNELSVQTFSNHGLLSRLQAHS
jgi:20S proteasome alpha/beta subunit